MHVRASWRWTGGLILILLAFMTLIALHCGAPQGKLEFVEYDFRQALGGKQRMVVYLPPGYPKDAPYPVLYLLHGGGDDELSWQTQGKADSTLDRLDAEKKIVPMIVVMPNAQGRGRGFQQDLFESVIPYIESHYAVRPDRNHRAIAGTSLGGWQALGIALNRPDRFAWVGGFSPALVDSVLPAGYDHQLKLIWLSCGDRDSHVKSGCSRLHQMFEEKQIPHVWHVSPGGHEWSVWKNDLFQFVPLLFRKDPIAKTQ